MFFPLRRIYFYLTGGCNLRCRHCWIAPPRNEGGGGGAGAVLDVDLFRSIVKQAKPLGLAGVKLTGGEPFLHPRVEEILAAIREEGLSVTVETNGVLCTPALSRNLAACPNALVSVSLDGADAETHEWIRGRPGSFAGALAGIRNLVAAGLRPQIIMTLMRRNRDHAEPVVRLAESLGAGSVKFNGLQPSARGADLYESGEALSIEELLALGRWADTTLAASTRLPLHSPLPPAFRPLGTMFGSDGGGCGVCDITSILGVLSTGAYALCGIGETVPDLVFGLAARDPLEEVWRATPALREIREGLPGRLEGICGECVMSGWCRGGCLAQNYRRGGDLWEPFWVCDLAEEQGLFPASRRRRAGRAIARV